MGPSVSATVSEIRDDLPLSLPDSELADGSAWLVHCEHSGQ